MVDISVAKESEFIEKMLLNKSPKNFNVDKAASKTFLAADIKASAICLNRLWISSKTDTRSFPTDLKAFTKLEKKRFSKTL